MAKILLILALAAIAWWWWRRRAPARPAPISSAEARRLLGVAEGASLEEIREAHRRLIARVHPDAGGSAELAARINAARDQLAGELNRKPPRAS
jgi:DnaJ homolog subfamily C member 19